MSVVVRPVSSWRDRREFVELPYRLHSTSAVWVPPLRVERHLFLMRSQNAFFAHGDAQLFLAWRDGRVVGRISAHVDANLDAFQGTNWGLFGFFECEDDAEAARGLIDAAGIWLQARGRPNMVGPGTESLFLTSGKPRQVSDRATQFLRRPIEFQAA